MVSRAIRSNRYEIVRANLLIASEILWCEFCRVVADATLSESLGKF